MRVYAALGAAGRYADGSVVARRQPQPLPRSNAPFPMATSDLAARPVFPRLREGIDARLTVVFAALAVSREAQARTGQSINEIVTPAGADADSDDHPRRPTDRRAATRPR